jgi:hypothetical protein
VGEAVTVVLGDGHEQREQLEAGAPVEAADHAPVDERGRTAGQREDVARVRVGVEHPVDEVPAVHEPQQVLADVRALAVAERAAVEMAYGGAGRQRLDQHLGGGVDDPGHGQ